MMLAVEISEGKRRTIAVVAAIFACRKLSVLEGRPSPARETAFRDSIQLAVKLLKRIDERFPEEKPKPNVSPSWSR